MLTTIDSLLDTKGRSVRSLPPNATVHDAVHAIVDERIEALLILSDDRLVGILTERDCARRVTLQGREPKGVRISEVMTSPVVFVRGEHTVGDCLQILADKGFSHLPVLDGEAVVGVVSMGDLVGSIIREQGDTISHLEGYVTGSYPG